MTCNACNGAIYDRLLYKTSPDNKVWHSECLKCCECKQLLDSKYFETKGRLYCRNDYLAYFGPSCFSCANKITDDQYFFSIKQTISSGDPLHGHQTTRTNTLFFHDSCFACNYCTRPLKKGEKYYILDNTSHAQKALMICHDMCALKYQSGNNLSNNNTMQPNANTIHAGGLPLQSNAPAPKAKRGRMKQNRPA